MSINVVRLHPFFSLLRWRCDCKDLLEVNKSVQDTIEKVTCLEMVLKEKLELIIPMVEDCEKKPHKDE